MTVIDAEPLDGSVDLLTIEPGKDSFIDLTTPPPGAPPRANPQLRRAAMRMLHEIALSASPKAMRKPRRS